MLDILCCDAPDLAGEIPRCRSVKLFFSCCPCLQYILLLSLPDILLLIRLRLRLRLDETRSSVASSAAVLSRLTNVIRIQSDLRLQLFVYRRVLAVRLSFTTALVC